MVGDPAVGDASGKAGTIMGVAVGLMVGVGTIFDVLLFFVLNTKTPDNNKRKIIPATIKGRNFFIGETDGICGGNSTGDKGIFCCSWSWTGFISYSHSIVAGGLVVISYTTRTTSKTSVTIRVEILSSTS